MYLITYHRFSYPGESNTVDSIGQHVPKHGGPGSQAGVVGMHVRALPVNYLWEKKKYTFYCDNVSNY